MSDAKFYTPADIQKALTERLKKFEVTLRELHGRELKKDEHQEPGVHEVDQGQGGHVEPGGHENSVMPMPQSPPESPVGSSHGIPQGQLQDLCLMCGQPDLPGQCTCLNGGGREAMNSSILSAAAGVPATPLALNEMQGYGPGAGPLAMSEKKEVSEPLCKLHKVSMCKACPSLEKDADFVDIEGKRKTVGVVGVLPKDKKPKEVDSQDDNTAKTNSKGLKKAALEKGLGGAIAGTALGLLSSHAAFAMPKPAANTAHGVVQHVSKLKKPRAKVPVARLSVTDVSSGGDVAHAPGMSAAPIAKSGPPIAKPPSGGPAGAVAPAPVAAAKAPKVAGPAGGPAKMGKGEDRIEGPTGKDRPEVVPQNSPKDKKFRADNKAATAAGKKGIPLRPGDGIAKATSSLDRKAMQQHANVVASKQSRVAEPDAPKAQPKPASHYDPAEYTPKPAAPSRLVVPGFKKSESFGVCLFCGNREHGGNCGLAKNIKSSLIKVASPLFQPIPKVKPAAQGLGHISNDAQEKTKLNDTVGSSPKAKASENTVKAEEGKVKTHVCAAPLCTKGISGESEFCKKHQPPKGK